VNPEAYPLALSIAESAKPHFPGSKGRPDKPTTVYALDSEWYEDLACALNFYHRMYMGLLPDKFGGMGATGEAILPAARSGWGYAPGANAAQKVSWKKVSLQGRYVATTATVTVVHFSPEGGN